MRVHKLWRRVPTIRQWLAMLLAAVIVPASLAVTGLFAYASQRERVAIERGALAVTHALVQAIDLELSGALGALQALATSPNLEAGNLRAFQVQATEVVTTRPGNVLLVYDNQGRQQLSTFVPFSQWLPPQHNRIGIMEVVRSGKPMVSDLYLGPTANRLLISVDVPVLREGRVRQVLSLQFFADRLGEMLKERHILTDNNATIYDSSSRIVWRNRGHERDIGRFADARLAAGLAQNREGTVEETGADGAPYVTVFSRSEVSNWAVAISLRRSALSAALTRSLAWIVAGDFVVLALGLALVRAIGARIERSITDLVEPAMKLGYGGPVLLPPLHLREAQAVGCALVQAAALLQERTMQRDAAEQAERQLRDANREIERSEAFLRGIFEESPDAVLLVDRECRITRANSQAEQLFGYRQGELGGMTINRLLVESGTADLPVCERIHEAPLRRGIDGEAPLHGRRGDGTAFPLDVMASPLRGSGLAILTVRDMTWSREQEEALRHTLDDKSTLLKELYHRVKNNLQLIISLFNLQVRDMPDSAARQALCDAVGRVRTMALVHERLYQSRTLSSIALSAYVSELCEQLAVAASAAQRGIALQVQADPVEGGLDVAVPIGLLINELVSNSLKHAFPEGRHGRIEVRLVREADDVMRLSVSDDGIGLPSEFERTSAPNLGLRLVSALSEQLRAHFKFESDGGVVASLCFKLPDAAVRD